MNDPMTTNQYIQHYYMHCIYVSYADNYVELFNVNYGYNWHEN